MCFAQIKCEIFYFKMRLAPGLSMNPIAGLKKRRMGMEWKGRKKKGKERGGGREVGY